MSALFRDQTPRTAFLIYEKKNIERSGADGLVSMSNPLSASPHLISIILTSQTQNLQDRIES